MKETVKTLARVALPLAGEVAVLKGGVEVSQAVYNLPVDFPGVHGNALLWLAGGYALSAQYSGEMSHIAKATRLGGVAASFSCAVMLGDALAHNDQSRAVFWGQVAAGIAGARLLDRLSQAVADRTLNGLKGIRG